MSWTLRRASGLQAVSGFQGFRVSQGTGDSNASKIGSPPLQI